MLIGWVLLSVLITLFAAPTVMSFKLFKYHKPVGVLSTTFRDVPGNIIDKGSLSPENKRVLMSTTKGPIVPIGRLDKDSRGLLLLTNSEQIIARLLRTKTNLEGGSSQIKSDDEDEEDSYGSKYTKVYEVTTLRQMTDDQLESMRRGVVISTFARNRSGMKNVRPTLPIGLERLIPLNYNNIDDRDDFASDVMGSSNRLLFTLREGRNRQIRKMVGKFGHAVVDLKRVSFGGIGLDGIEDAGMLAPLNQQELNLLGIKKLL